VHPQTLAFVHTRADGMGVKVGVAACLLLLALPWLLLLLLLMVQLELTTCVCRWWSLALPLWTGRPPFYCGVLLQCPHTAYGAADSSSVAAIIQAAHAAGSLAVVATDLLAATLVTKVRRAHVEPLSLPPPIYMCLQVLQSTTARQA
jgi:glycine cleavage system pyridoxal-binding protein P